MSKRTPTEEQKRLVARWRDSGQTKSAFARSNDISVNTFWAWTHRHPTESAQLAPIPSFVDVTPEPTPSQLAVRLSAPGHPPCELEFDILPPPGWFAAVLREMAAC